MPSSRKALCEALIYGGYAFYYDKKNTINQISIFLRTQKCKWTFARNIEPTTKHYSATFVATCMHDIACLTENTWSNVAKLYNFIDQLFEKRRVNILFWNSILPRTVEKMDGDMNLSMYIQYQRLFCLIYHIKS